MTTAKITSVDAPAALTQAAKVIRSGGLIVYPTDTLYGFGCDAGNPAAITKMNRVKQRSGPISVIAPDLETALIWTSLDKGEFPLIREYLGGPRTVIIPVKPGVVVDTILGPEKTLGIRIPKAVFILELARLTGVPITTTSVNKSGQRPLNDPAKIMETFQSDFDLLIDGGRLPPSNGSTIYRWQQHKMKLLKRRS